MAETLNKDVEVLLSSLAAHGIDTHQDQIVKDVAAKYGTTPSSLLEQMKLQRKTSETTNMQGRGYGRMNIDDMCSQLQIDLSQALQRLQAVGIVASKETSIKDLATENDLRPSDLVNIISGVETK